LRNCAVSLLSRAVILAMQSNQYITDAIEEFAARVRQRIVLLRLALKPA
jgi:hypothetical protein